MARIAGVNIPDSKRVEVSLTYIYGIGFGTAKDICDKVGLSYDIRVRNLSEQDIAKLRDVISANYVVEGEKKREVYLNIKRMMDLGSYRGLRHRKNLPVRGQRTHTNARTRKGPAVTIAGKKK